MPKALYSCPADQNAADDGPYSLALACAPANYQGKRPLQSSEPFQGLPLQQMLLQTATFSGQGSVALVSCVPNVVWDSCISCQI